MLNEATPVALVVTGVVELANTAGVPEIKYQTAELGTRFPAASLTTAVTVVTAVAPEPDVITGLITVATTEAAAP